MDIENVLKGHGIGTGAGGSNIKSIQRGSVTMTAKGQTITISPVDTTKAIVRINYFYGSSQIGGCLISAELTNSTTITLNQGGSLSYQVVEWEVIEFNNIKSLQRGIATTTTASSDITISSVDTLKSIIFYSHQSTSTSTTLLGNAIRVFLLSNTKLQVAQREAINLSTYWQVIEFN